jgi:hypothetical protein
MGVPTHGFLHDNRIARGQPCLRQCSGMSPELSRDSLPRLTAEGERMIARVARFTGQPKRFTSGEYRWVLTAGLLE